MTFTVTYRDTDGALREEAVEAANRAECVVAFKARGIVPVGVREGRAVSMKPARRNTPGGKVVFVMVGFLLAAILGGVCWWWRCGDRGTAALPGDAPKRAVAARREAPQHGPVQKPAPAPTGEPCGETAATTNAVKAARPQKYNKAKEIADARRAVQATNGYVRVKKERPFKTAADQAMAMLMSIPPGQAVPPIPLRPGAEEEFRKMVDTPIEILETDNEKVRALKESVRECRKELKRLLDEGLSLQEIVTEHRTLANENAQIRRDAAREAKEMLEKGSREDAEKYVKTINAALSQMGIPAISMPMTREERHRLAVERLAEKKRKAAEKATPK